MYLVKTAKLTLLEITLVVSLYITILEPFFRGVFRPFGLEYFILAAIYLIAYIFPVLFSMGRSFKGSYLKDLSILIVLNMLYFIILILPSQQDIGFIYALNGFKNYYYPTIMIVIVSRVIINNPYYYNVLIKNFIILSTILSIYLLFEVFSRYYFHNTLYHYVATLSNPNSLIHIKGGVRPLGLTLSFYHNAVIASIAVLMLFFYKAKLSSHYLLLTAINFAAVILSLSKTYSAALLLSLIIYSVIKAEVKIWVQLAIGLSVLVLIMFIFQDLDWFITIREYYNHFFNLNGELKAVKLMIEKIYEAGYFIENSLLPNGFQPELYVTTKNVNIAYANQEISAYKFIFQMGFFGYLLYLSIFFYILFKTRFALLYTGVLSIVFIGFLHYAAINKLYIIIILSAIGARCYILLHDKTLKSKT
jgi:hypothetical protein